jgi:hypothetical protein
MTQPRASASRPAQTRRSSADFLATSSTGTRSGRRALDGGGSERRSYALLSIWSLAVGLLGALVLVAITPTVWPTLAERATGMRDSLAVLNHGGPLLLGHDGASGALYAPGADEKQGLYVYFPLLSHLLGVADPVSMVRYSYITLFALAAAIYPLVFYRLTRSPAAAVAAPLMLLVCAASLGFNDIYWIPAWGILISMPLVFLLARDWSRAAIPLLVAIALTAGWVSSIRGGSGIGIAVAAAIAVVLHRPRWWKLLATLALLACAYMSTNALIVNLAREHRDDRIGTHALDASTSSESDLWHTTYIGLGYLANDYGLGYDDTYAESRAQQDAPGTTKLSSRYATVLRRAWLRLVRQHPTEVAKQYAAKAVVTVANAACYLAIVLVTGPAMLLLGSATRIRRRWFLLTLPVLAVAFMPTILAIPFQRYEQAFYGALGLLGILGLCWTIGRIEAAIRRSGGVRGATAELFADLSAPSRERRLLGASLGLSLILLLVVIVLIAEGRRLVHPQTPSAGVMVGQARPLHSSAPAIASRAHARPLLAGGSNTQRRASYFSAAGQTIR